MGVEVIDRCNLTGAAGCEAAERKGNVAGWPRPRSQGADRFERLSSCPCCLTALSCPWFMPACVCAMPAVLLEPGQEDLALFLADHRVRVVASLPCYSSGELTPAGRQLWLRSPWLFGLPILS